ncbi:M23 family metallopeptidase [Aliiroseovarius crassostreae]|uniref:M23 family metallopeptidase n=1 Tax=Aliiroseovarius crassostreae TaxID=154981 RepID=UPI0021FE65AF|nr:M23 family metallopeptidase [Aliiroseovarius crassostreae]UWQ11582.1 M23 family metallopeptidase [Aliiroseovarius crassostreae]
MILALAAAPAAAFADIGGTDIGRADIGRTELRGPKFAQPVDCVLGESCFILNLTDADPGEGVADYTCGPRSYDGHKGTDFALPSHAAMRKGVTVLAAAPGRVKGRRDGMKDALYGSEGAPDVSGRDCGNGVVIDHGGGWESQYCHMAQGSVTVRTGDKVRMGQELGRVGLSGKTQYPHLHLSLRKDGKVVDPFHPDAAFTAPSKCLSPDLSDGQLWLTPIPYPSGGIASTGFATDTPQFDEIKQGNTPIPPLPADGPALVGWSMVYGPRQGDILHLRIEGPTGMVGEQKIEITKTQVLAFRAFGKKTRTAWPEGMYRLDSWMIRAGKVIDATSTEVAVR